MARVEIELIQPRHRCRRRGSHVHRVTRCLPTAVDRRREQRVCAFLGDSLRRSIENLFELALEECSNRVRPFGGCGIQAAQRPFKIENSTRRQRGRAAESRLADVYLPFADFRRQVARIARFEQFDQRFEITARACAKLPVKIYWQPYRQGRLRSQYPSRFQFAFVLDLNR